MEFLGQVINWRALEKKTRLTFHGISVWHSLDVASAHKLKQTKPNQKLKKPKKPKKPGEGQPQSRAKKP
jgi:hypothetical protein